MTTAVEVAAYGRSVDDLATLALRDVQALLSAFGDSDPVEVRNGLLLALPEVISPYLTASGDLAATWYEDLRAAAVGGSFYAKSSGVVNDAHIESLVRWGVKPLFGQGSSSVLSLVGGGVQRMVANAGRDTIFDNVMADRVRVGYARIPRAGCCAFCSMLASRGAVYNSAESAGGVVGRGVDAAATAGKRGGQGKGVKARGARSLGSREYHDFCRCRAAPVFAGDTFHKEVEEKHLALYPGTGGGSTKEVLAQMRAENGTR
ncbi:MAG: hypothetical protein ABWX92_15815 [Mycetocola sp.]